MAVEVPTQGDFLELVHRVDKLERRLAVQERGLDGLTETFENRTAGLVRLGSRRDEDVIPIFQDAKPVARSPLPAPGAAVDELLLVADLGPLRPFRASPHAKENILTAGGRIFLALCDADPAIRDAVVAALNGVSVP